MIKNLNKAFKAVKGQKIFSKVTFEERKKPGFKSLRAYLNETEKQLELQKDKLKDLPFSEIMELINARHGFFYNKNSKKKLDRYAGKVSRRIVRRSTRKSKRSSKIAGYSSH